MSADTREQVIAIITEFQKRRRRQLMVTVPVVALFIAGILVRRTDLLEEYNIPLEVIAPVIIGGILLALAFSLYNWRCPQCNKYLGRDISPKFCAKCGAQLRV